MKKYFTAVAMAAAAPVAMTASAPVAVAQDKDDVSFEVPAPPEGKGQILFYRTNGIQGAALGCGIFDAEGTEKLSSLGRGTYFILVSDPGERSFKAKSIESKDILTLEVEPDETQFVRCKIKMGFLSGRPNISPSSEKEFRKKYKSPKLVDADDMADDIRAMNYAEAEAAEEAVAE